MIKFFKENLTVKNLFIFALLTQTAFFILCAYFGRNTWLYSDNTFYETPAWNLASGNGLSFARSEWEDPYLTDLYYARHPEQSGNEFVPTSTLPIGYAIFLAGIYSVFGRSFLAAILANLFLLYAFLAALFVLSKRIFADRLQNKILWVLVAVFPFWAYWASKIISDPLHTALMTLFFLFTFTRKEKPPILAGVCLGLACIVRPYAILLPIFLLIGGFLFKNEYLSLKRVGVLGVICWLIIGGWVARNYYWFDKPMLTAMGPGASVWLATHKNVFHDYTADDWVPNEHKALGIRDPHSVADGEKLLALALERIKERPGHYLLANASSFVRLWIPLGGSSTPFAVKLLLGGYFIFIYISMLYGVWLAIKNRDSVLIGFAVVVFYYSFIFSWLTVEARYMLPVRALGFILSSIAVAHFTRKYFSASEVKAESID